MRTSINQNRIPLSLPDLRNLGTILRILLLVNAIVMIAAFVREDRGPAISEAWLQMSAFGRAAAAARAAGSVSARSLAGARAVRRRRRWVLALTSRSRSPSTPCLPR